MNKHIKEMIQRNMVFGGKIISNNGIIMFERLPLEELEKLDESEIAFATQSMGRAIFTIDSDGKIKNYKGVDSHFDNNEISTVDLVSAKSVHISNPGKSYLESTYPVNLVIFPGEKVDVRVRGASPLEDLEIEADINSKMQGMGIKLPQIISVKEFPYEFAEIIGLPTKVTGSYEEFTSDYAKKDMERKSNLRRVYGDRYIEDKVEGLRPERISEYFTRIGVFESTEFKQFAEENGVTIEDFANYVDRVYSLGQRYGQAERIIENPFRISDLEYYIKNGDIEAIQNIVDFSEELRQGQIPMENVFSRQMGINIANMMNSGWVSDNFVHRQDYTLAGEMCDDSYLDVVEQLRCIDEKNRNNVGKRKVLRDNVMRKYFSQFYHIGSNIKVLQDEMNLREKSKEEIDYILSEYVNSFAENIDFEKIGKRFSVEPEKVKVIFANLIGVPRNYTQIMAMESRKEGIIQDEAILLAHRDNNGFYNDLSERLAKILNIDRSMIAESSNVLRSAVKTTEEVTRTSSIEEQAKVLQKLTIKETQKKENEKNLNGGYQ